jgi:hypothetical protein
METEHHVWRRVLRVLVLMSGINPSRTIVVAQPSKK